MNQYAPPARITLISHPATPEQRAGVFPLDEPLDQRARTELEAIAWRAPESARVLTAPEQRTRQTAAVLGVNAIEAPELRECDFGLWRGVALETLLAENPSALAAWLNEIEAAPHQGESFSSLIVRAGQWLELQQDAGHIVAVTHASVVRAILVCALQVSPKETFRSIEIAPLTMTDIRFSGGRWSVRSVGVPLSGGTPD